MTMPNQRLVTPSYQVALAAPAERMLVLHAYHGRDHDGKPVVDGVAYPVVSIVAVQDAQGRVKYSPVFLYNGELVSLPEARGAVWPADSLDEVVVCTWPRDCDEDMLKGRVRAMIKRLARQMARKASKAKS